MAWITGGIIYMKILVIPDSFKGSLTSAEAGRSIEKGIKRVYSNAQVTIMPLADGGEGTVDALAYGCNGKIYNINVTGPAGRKVLCKYAVINGNTAVIEMAGAAGLAITSPEERNPLYTTTYGAGEVIKDAIKRGCRKFIIGINATGSWLWNGKYRWKTSGIWCGRLKRTCCYYGRKCYARIKRM